MVDPFFSGYKTKHNHEHMINTVVVKMLGKHFHVEFINEAPNANIQIDLLFEERRGFYYMLDQALCYPLVDLRQIQLFSYLK